MGMIHCGRCNQPFTDWAVACPRCRPRLSLWSGMLIGAYVFGPMIALVVWLWWLFFRLVPRIFRAGDARQ